MAGPTNTTNDLGGGINAGPVDPEAVSREVAANDSSRALSAAKRVPADGGTDDCSKLFAEFAARGVRQPLRWRVRRRTLILLPAVLLVGGLAVWAAGPSELAAEDADRIRPGMTLREAEHALGYRIDGKRPEGRMPDPIRSNGFGYDPLPGAYHWDLEGGQIIAFHRDGTIFAVRVARIPDVKARSRLARWLGL